MGVIARDMGKMGDMGDMGDMGGFVMRHAMGGSGSGSGLVGCCFIRVFIISYLVIFVLFVCCFVGFCLVYIVICSHCSYLSMHYPMNHSTE